MIRLIRANIYKNPRSSLKSYKVKIKNNTLNHILTLNNTAELSLKHSSNWPENVKHQKYFPKSN